MRLGLIAAAATAGVGAALGLSACADDEEEGKGTDVEDVQQRDMERVEQFSNVDGYSHLVRACIDGVAFAFTGSDPMPVLRVPDWDETFCVPGSAPIGTHTPLPQPTD